MSKVLDWVVPRLFPGSFEEWIVTLQTLVEKKNLSLIFTPNPEQVELAERDAVFFANLQQADILLADGNGLLWAAHQKEKKKDHEIHRITGRETLQAWLEQDVSGMPRTLLLGGHGESAVLVATKVDPSKKHVRGLVGFADVTHSTEQEQKLVWDLIKTWKPSVLFVGFGAPKQEQWLVENRAALESAGVRVGMAVGGSFDVLSGALALPPNWIVQSKLEWLYRLWQQPHRLSRQLWLLRFVLRVLAG